MSDQYGSIKTGSEVEQAVIDILKKWAEVYIAELEFQIGWNKASIPKPRSYTTRNSPEHFAEDQLPQVIVVSPGLAEPPKRDGSGVYRATWMIGVAVIVSAKDEPTTKALAKFYAAVARSILIQHRSLDNKAIGLEWYDESYDDIPDEADTARVLAAGTVYFKIDVDDVGTGPGGPRTPEPPTPSTSDWPGESRWPDPSTLTPDPQAKIVQSVTVTLKREAL